MARTLRGEIKPVQAIVKPPMVYNIIFQNTYAEPLLPITKASMDLEQSNPKILAVSRHGRVSVRRRAITWDRALSS